MIAQELTPSQVEAFRENGFVVIRNYYDREKDLEPIQRGIHGILGLMIKKYGGGAIAQPRFTRETFDAGYQALIALDRRIGGEVYDAIKQIPALVRLVACERHENILRQLRDTDAPGIAAGGYGIRIDNPNEERFRAPWHQEYPAQLRSVDGLVFWTCLVPVTAEMGPVLFCPGSHRDGLRRVHTRDPRNPDKQGAYALVLENEEQIVSRYPCVSTCTEPGDLVVVDFLTLHASGRNRGNRSRWTIQSRLFNFREPTGVKHGWKGSFASGVDFKDIHPVLVAD